MRIVCQKNEIQRSVSIVSKAVALKSPVAIMEGITRGEADIREGLVFTHNEVKQKLSKWLK